MTKSFIVSVVSILVLLFFVLGTVSSIVKSTKHVPIINKTTTRSDGLSFVASETPSLFVKDNTIFLSGVIGESTVNDIQTFITAIDRTDKYKDMLIVIDSPGGSTTAMLSIISTILESSKPVNTYTDGMAASAAAVIFASGHHRIVSPASILMTHEAKIMFSDVMDAKTAKNEEASLDKFNIEAADLLAAFTHHSRKWVQDNLEVSGKDTFSTPSDAIKEGLADEIAILGVR